MLRLPGNVILTDNLAGACHIKLVNLNLTKILVFQTSHADKIKNQMKIVLWFSIHHRSHRWWRTEGNNTDPGRELA